MSVLAVALFTLFMYFDSLYLSRPGEGGPMLAGCWLPAHGGAADDPYSSICCHPSIKQGGSAATAGDPAGDIETSPPRRYFCHSGVGEHCEGCFLECCLIEWKVRICIGCGDRLVYEWWPGRRKWGDAFPPGTGWFTHIGVMRVGRVNGNVVPENVLLEFFFSKWKMK